MSEPTGAPHPRRIRMWYVAAAGAVATLIVLVAVVLNGQSGSSGPSSYEASRAAYETALLNNPNRVDGDFGVQIHDDAGGAVYTYETRVLTVSTKSGLKNACESRCMVGHKTADGYAVTLPVSFTYRVGMQDFSPMPGSQPVTELTYWDTQQHRAVTVHSSKGGAVALPRALYGHDIDSVRVGETVYLVPQLVRSDGGHTVVLDHAGVWYEPGGKLYNIVDLAKVTKTDAGFDVCLPTGYQPISEKGVQGPAAHVLNERC